jgi:hypothetical protein
VVGSAVTARECTGATVGLVGSAASRKCDAAESVEGKWDVVVVGFAFALIFAFALEVVVGMLVCLLVGIEGLPRG